MWYYFGMVNLESKSFRELPNSVNIEFSEDILKFGGSQKFVVMEDEKSNIYFATQGKDHKSIKESFENKFNKNFVSRGGGFLSYDPYTNTIKIQEGFSTRLGPVTVPTQDLIAFLKENTNQYNFEVEN